MNPKIKRRQFIKNMGWTLALPLLPSLFLPKESWGTDATSGKKFIGVYFPDGTYMPGGTNGYWNFTDSLSPLTAHRNNIAVIRGLTAGHSGLDIHWTGCGGFLSCGAFPTQPANIRIAKTIDQYIADQKNTPMRSLHMGWRFRNFSEHPTSHSPIYLNVMSWKTDTIGNQNIFSPKDLFNRVFGGGAIDAKRFELQNRSKKSILDSHVRELSSLNSKASNQDKLILDSYLTGIREIEKDIGVTFDCPANDIQILDNEYAYNNHFRVMQKILVKAMACNLTDVATVMYDAGVGDNDLVHDGTTRTHHSYAHHGNSNVGMEGILHINRIHTGLLSELISELKNNNIFNKTLVLYGTDMADGNIHSNRNIPCLVATGMSGVRVGQEIGTHNVSINHGDMLLEVLKTYGINKNSIGTGLYAGTGRSIGLKI